jgi:hypothetical protein
MQLGYLDIPGDDIGCAGIGVHGCCVMERYKARVKPQSLDAVGPILLRHREPVNFLLAELGNHDLSIEQHRTMSFDETVGRLRMIRNRSASDNPRSSS